MFKFNKIISETLKNVALWPLWLTLNVFKIKTHCSIYKCAVTAQINPTVCHSIYNHVSR